MSLHNSFYVYTGPATAVLNAIDGVEKMLKKRGISCEAEQLKKDRLLLNSYLKKNVGVLFIRLRVKVPDKCRFVFKGNSFHAYLTKGMADKGGYEGQQVWMLYLIPRKPDEGNTQQFRKNHQKR